MTAEGDAGNAGAGARARLPLLDVLRGVAILGTLMSNVWIFAGPGAEWGVLTGNAATSAGADSSTLAGAAETVFRALANGKFLSMLTILFGVGLAIQFRSAAQRGQPWPGRYKWRALFLFTEGTVHFVLVFAWDVLMGYAVVALLVAWLLTRSARAQRVTWIAMGVLHLAAMTLLTAAMLLASDGATDGGPDTDTVTLYAQGGYAEQVAFRLSHAVALRMEPVLSFGLLVCLFLLGVRLFRAGAFQNDAAGRRIRRRLAGWGLGIGLPLTALAALGGPGFFLLERYGAAPVLAVGYLGLIGMAMDRLRHPGPLAFALISALTSVGRTALSCYVLQNVLAMLACYGIGLGLASRWADSGPWWVMGLWAAICLVLVTGASLWLRRFEHGPLESVQKRLLRR
ncbi:DUF418 domain-containing protein [Streptomyces sp. NPDC048483]|uniref:DUF418 domain-containing protein n=1 Tax=Streptomyces sp. NPDC048483 TaxID=3154927 RepID=UPI003440FB3A